MIGLKRGLFLPCVTPSKVFKLMLMTKKRKLNSKNPKYWSASKKDGPSILKKVHMCDATLRNAQGKATNQKAAVYAVWYKD